MYERVAVTLSLLLVGGPVSTSQEVNLTGNWVLDSVSGTEPRGSGAGVGWGPDFIAVQVDQRLTVISGGAGRLVTKAYRLDGVEAKEGTTDGWVCPDYDLTTNAVWKGKLLVITERTSYRPCRMHDPNPTFFGPARFPKSDFTFVSAVLTISMPGADALMLEIVAKPQGGEKDVTSLRTYRRKR